MGLGLPLQGPGWTESACVRGGGYLHQRPPGGLARGLCACFWSPAASLACRQQPGADRQPAEVGVEEVAFELQINLRLSYATPGLTDACRTFHMVGGGLKCRIK